MCKSTKNRKNNSKKLKTTKKIIHIIRSLINFKPKRWSVHLFDNNNHNNDEVKI